MVFFFLCLISVVEVFSASSSLSYKSGNFFGPMLGHLGKLLMGVGCMLVVVNIKCKYFKVITLPLLLLSFAMLVWVLCFGESENDASRWISVLGMKFQPSEIAKGALVLATAQILSAMQTPDGADKHAFHYILIVSAFIILPILVENFSTAALLSLVILMMMIIGRVPMSQIGKLLGVVALMAFVLFVAIMTFGKDEAAQPESKQMTEVAAVQAGKNDDRPRVLHRLDTWKARVDKFMDSKDVAPEDVDLDKDAQVAHANIAIASSNGIGKGPGNSVERDFLSQAFSDFIYAIIIEEMGIIGAAFVALLYIILLFRTGRIANRCRNSFPAFLAMGLALLLVTQALFNMCVAVGLAPVTGQPLPLISRGGTSSVINCIYIGMILSISRSAQKRDTACEQPVAPGVAVAAA